jgi:hypothetical protein
MDQRRVAHVQARVALGATRASSEGGCHRTDVRLVSLLRNVLANVPSQHVVDEGLVPHTAPACFLAELIEHSSVDTNRNELTWFVAERRATDAAHGFQLRRR